MANSLKAKNGLVSKLRRMIRKSLKYRLGFNQYGQLLMIPECGIEKELTTV